MKESTGNDGRVLSLYRGAKRQNKIMRSARMQEVKKASSETSIEHYRTPGPILREEVLSKEPCSSTVVLLLAGIP